MKKIKKLLDEYRFPGFRPLAILKGKFGDNRARIIRLVRRQKKLYAVAVGRRTRASTTGRLGWSETCLVVIPEYFCQWRYGESTV